MTSLRLSILRLGCLFRNNPTSSDLCWASSRAKACNVLSSHNPILASWDEVASSQGSSIDPGSGSFPFYRFGPGSLRHLRKIEDASGVALWGWAGSRSLSGSSPKHQEKVERGPRHFQIIAGVPLSKVLTRHSHRHRHLCLGDFRCSLSERTYWEPVWKLSFHLSGVNKVFFLLFFFYRSFCEPEYLQACGTAPLRCSDPEDSSARPVLRAGSHYT